MSSPSIVDLRSDTVTKPTAAMREAMMTCEVDDDVFGTDPTVNELESQMAKYLGKEAALFVPSGTMSNLIACLTHCSSGRMNELILGDQSHIFLNESGGIAALGGIQPRTVRNLPDGTMSLQEVEDAIRPLGNPHYPITKLICLESSHNAMGGRAVGKHFIDSVAAICQRHNLKLHLDGARLMNSAVFLNEKPDKLVENCDSISFCLSKGLASPVGSCLVGSREFISAARHLRKQLGGGMRQAGILAACGLISLNSMVERLKDDHARCLKMAQSIGSMRGMQVAQTAVETNIVYFELKGDEFAEYFTAGHLAQALAKRGILIVAMGKMKVRLVTHYMIDDAAVDRTIQQFQAVLEDNYRK